MPRPQRWQGLQRLHKMWSTRHNNTPASDAPRVQSGRQPEAAEQLCTTATSAPEHHTIAPTSPVTEARGFRGQHVTHASGQCARQQHVSSAARIWTAAHLVRNAQVHTVLSNARYQPRMRFHAYSCMRFQWSCAPSSQPKTMQHAMRCPLAHCQIPLPARCATAAARLRSPGCRRRKAHLNAKSSCHVHGKAQERLSISWSRYTTSSVP